ncbi:hypothetical protein BJX99DRAFT_230879 [Aspergillus californicus]
MLASLASPYPRPRPAVTFLTRSRIAGIPSRNKHLVPAIRCITFCSVLFWSINNIYFILSHSFPELIRMNELMHNAYLGRFSSRVCLSPRVCL